MTTEPRPRLKERMEIDSGTDTKTAVNGLMIRQPMSGNGCLSRILGKQPTAGRSRDTAGDTGLCFFLISRHIGYSKAEPIKTG